MCEKFFVCYSVDIFSDGIKCYVWI